MLTRRFTFFCSLAPLLIFPMKIPFVSDGLILILIWAVSGGRYFFYALGLQQLMALPNEISAVMQFANLPMLVKSMVAIKSQVDSTLNLSSSNPSLAPNPILQIAVFIATPFILYVVFLYYRNMFRSFKRFVHLVRYLRWIARTYHAQR